MAKLTTQQKLDILSDTAQEQYELKANHDTICGACLQLALDNGIGFGEVSPLVKHLGEVLGFIVPVAVRKEKFQTMMNSCGLMYETHQDYMDDTKNLAERNNLPLKWVRNIIIGICKAQGNPVPEKTELLEWQKALVDCFLNNPGMTKADVDTCVSRFKKETSIPKSMLAMLQYMYKEIS